MKTIKSITAALLLLLITTTTAYAIGDDRPKKSQIHKELTKLLRGPDFYVEKDVKAIAHVIVNDHNELIVISVTTEDENLESYVKSRLNYHKVKSKMETGIPYLIPIRMTASQ
ncbi:MAG: hypothetical protein AAFP76_03270 [Bacteroidota bacterium]